MQGYIEGLGNAFAMIDPCVFVDDDGQAYFYYGGGGRRAAAKLKDNMMEIAEPLRDMEGLKDFHEATWCIRKTVFTICRMLTITRIMEKVPTA